MSINDELEELYSQHWANLLEQGRRIGGPEPTSPMLLSVDTKVFSKASKRIVICGQETWGWKPFGGSVADSMAFYHKFFIEQEFYDGYGRSAFWKAFRYFERELRAAFAPNECVFIYQNLCKMGRNDGATGVTEEIRKLEQKSFAVVGDELAILRPDIVIFLTGPDRDGDIRFHFPGAQFKQAGAEINLKRSALIEGNTLLSNALRLYHPNYFRAWTQDYKDAARDLILKRV